MKLSEARHRHLVVGNEVAGFGYAVRKIADGEEIGEIRLLTDDAIQAALKEASEDMKRGHMVRDEIPIENNGELVEIDIAQEEAKAIIAEDYNRALTNIYGMG
jgi:hypothetical protein